MPHFRPILQPQLLTGDGTMNKHAAELFGRCHGVQTVSKVITFVRALARDKIARWELIRLCQERAVLRHAQGAPQLAGFAPG